MRYSSVLVRVIGVGVREVFCFCFEVGVGVVVGEGFLSV